MSQEERDVKAYQQHLAADPASAHLQKLISRCRWLSARIEAKVRVGWNVVWDTAERDALKWALGKLGVPDEALVLPPRE